MEFDKFMPIAGAVLATAVSMYGLKMVFRNKGGKANNVKRYRAIPTPPGAIFYFGTVNPW